jgi:hypothetical protein
VNPFIFGEFGYLLPMLAAAGAFGLIHHLTRPPVLTYQEAISYFIKQRPPDHNIVRGALLLERSASGGITVRWLFLDGNNEPVADDTGTPYGRTRRYATLSHELQDEFKGTDLLVVS